MIDVQTRTAQSKLRIPFYKQGSTPKCPKCGLVLYPNNVHVKVEELGHGVYMLSYQRGCKE